LQKKSKISIALLLIALSLWYFIGGGYLSNDPLDPIIGMRITFPEEMKEVSPIPELLMAKEIRNKYKRAIIPISSNSLGINLPSRVKGKIIAKDKIFYIKDVIYLKSYGVISSAFHGDTSYYLLQDNRGKESIFYTGDNHKLFQ